MPIALQIKEVTTELNNKIIVNNINLKIQEKEVFGIIGTSGSGKSVLLKTISGFFNPKIGKILSSNKDLIKNKKFSKELLGFSTQEDSFYENLTAKENIEYFGRLYNLKKDFIEKRTTNLLTLLDLQNSENKLAKHLSGGMKRRLNIACALIHNPKILLLDEPISGLDPILREHVLYLVQKIRKQGTTVIMTSHFINEIEPFCDRVGIINNGSLLAVGTSMNLRQTYSNVYEISIRSYPGKYNKIFKLAKKNLQILNAYTKHNELVMFVPQKFTVNSYTRFITSLLEKNNEYLININIHQSPLNEIFKKVVESAKP